MHESEDLPSVQKFHLLKNALRGQVASVISGLNASEENYLVAWNLLQTRCNKPRQIVYAHIKSLYELPEATGDSPSSLRVLAESAQMHVNALLSLKQPVQTWDTILVYILTKKLDKGTRRAWDRTLEDDQMPGFKQLIAFMNKRSRGDESDDECSNAPKASKQSMRLRTKEPKRGQVLLATNSSNSCEICGEDHLIFTCARFLQLSVRDRIDSVKRAKLCINCLKPNHIAFNCRFGSCRKCTKKHHTLLHLPFEPRQNATTIKEATNSDVAPTAEMVKSTLTVTFDSGVLLGTALVKVRDRDDNEHVCRVLLDSGSQAHLMTDGFADKLQLVKHEIDLSFYGLSRLRTRARHFVHTIVNSRDDSFQSRVTFITLPTITGLLPASQVDRRGLQISRGIMLADPEFHKPAAIDALLGNSLFYRLLCNGQIRLCNEEIILQQTQLGWIVTGSLNWQKRFSVMEPLKSHHVVSSLEDSLNRFWEIEEIPEKPLFSREETLYEEHFVRNVSRDASGRYMVRLPFNQQKELIGNSRGAALNRFISLERKLHQNPRLLDQYKQFLDEYLKLGHMSEVSQAQEGKGFYLPHHAVIKESSVTIKVRVVFDASAKSSTGVSLNDALLAGPTIQDTLWSILIRFRFHVFVLTADIEKMFRQILVHPEDADYQKILWRSSRDEPIKAFRLDTVTYGTAAAPFLAVRCLKQLAIDEGDKYLDAARCFKNDFYVDDLLTGASTFEEALKLRNELIAFAKLGGFNLRQWASNEVRLTNDLQEDSSQEALCLDHAETKKTLAVFWNPSNDNIVYKSKPFADSQRCTKRLILSQISRLFDPLGLLGPVIIQAKIIMQQLWKANISWDETVPQHVLQTWLDFRGELHLLDNFSAPRGVVFERYSNIQLHGFCDASESAYGACVFIRISNNKGTHEVNLLCAKSRVAPVKVVSLPRLELCAARLLGKLYTEAVRSLSGLEFDLIRFWSDSSITLQWIKTAPHLLKTFVANRVSKIQADTSTRSWYHVASADNPADFISRGQSPAQFVVNKVWLKGPHWLSQDESFWPVSNVTVDNVPERRNILSFVIEQRKNDIFSRFSSITMLTRVVAYIFRFVYNARNKERVRGELTSQEIHRAHGRIVREVQAETFAGEIKGLRQGRGLPRGSRLSNLSPFLDKDGLLRVGGRLKHAPLSYAQKHPLLLPRTHHITELIIRHEHIRHWHSGLQATLNAVRQGYWPIVGKNAVKRLIHGCIRCCKLNPKIPSYIMGNLPGNRVTQTRPFQNIGIDFCGPFFIKEKKLRNRSKVKAYVSVFVCFASKAVHLELVTDLTTEAFLAALRRFFARRGRPQNIYTDNGTNFVGARNEILQIRAFLASEEHANKMGHFLSAENIQWHFSPPRSPHFGGLWEAAVKSFKGHLYRTVGEGLFTYEQFNTLIIEIEAILNSRPLIPLSSDPNDLVALSPGHFLIGDSLCNLPERDFLDVPRNRLSFWQHVQKVKQHFWTRWQKEYLQGGQRSTSSLAAWSDCGHPSGQG